MKGKFVNEKTTENQFMHSCIKNCGAGKNACHGHWSISAIVLFFLAVFCNPEQKEKYQGNIYSITSTGILACMPSPQSMFGTSARQNQLQPTLHKIKWNQYNLHLVASKKLLLL